MMKIGMKSQKLLAIAPMVLNTVAMTEVSEHQSHDTGIGQDIAEPAGGGIVKSPEQAAELAEDALGAA